MGCGRLLHHGNEVHQAERSQEAEQGSPAAALALLDVGRQYAQGLETDDVGSFIFGVPMAVGSYFLPAFFRTFLRDAPRITLSL